MQAIGLMALIACLLVTAGCKRRYSGSGPKLVLWHMEDARIMPFMEELIAQFVREQGGSIEVEQVHYDPEDLHQQYLTAAIAGAGPDVVLGASDKAGIFSIGKFIHPVEQYIDTKEYLPVAIEAVTDGGHIWGIPVSAGNHLMLFVNRNLAKAIPENTDDLLKICKGILDKDEKAYCLASNNGEPFFFMPWLTGFDGWPIVGTTPSLDTPPMRAALMFFEEMLNDGRVMPPECDYNCMDGLFKEGRLAFAINGDWAIEAYRERLGEAFQTAVLPKISATGIPMRPMVGGKYLMLNSRLKGEQLERALAFVRFMTSYENQLKQFDRLGRLPGLKKAFVAAKKKAPDFIKGSFDELTLGKPMPMQVEMRAVWDAMRSQMGAYFGGRKTLDQAVTLMESDALRKAKEMRLR